jgi:anti-anti-sigma factor
MAGRLAVDVGRRDRAVVVDVRGELDAYTMPAWWRITCEAAAHAAAPGTVVVDITGLDFIAGGPLGALADLTDACRKRGVALVVLSRAPVVQRIAAVTGLDKRLVVRATLRAALAAGTA